MYKKSLIKIFFYFIFVTLLLLGMNYLVDPYGYNSREGKFVKNLTMFNKPNITNSRLQSDGYYYLIGSSRMARVDPNLIEDITGKATHNVKVDGATFLENFLLASKIKKKDSHFIYSFDVFSLNSFRQTFKEVQGRSEIYKNEFEKGVFFTKYFNSDITIRSLQHLIKHFKGEKKDKQYLEENSRLSSFSLENALNESGVLNNRNQSNFSNFKGYSLDEVANLAQLGTKDDIFILFPKYYQYYAMFSKHQKIEEEYFSALRALVKNTKAQVWSFYGINNITKSEANFIDNGWHFKPQISNIMFNQIFKSNTATLNNNSGVLLTEENIDNYLLSLKDDNNSNFIMDSI